MLSQRLHSENIASLDLHLKYCRCEIRDHPYDWRATLLAGSADSVDTPTAAADAAATHDIFVGGAVAASGGPGISPPPRAEASGTCGACPPSTEVTTDALHGELRASSPERTGAASAVPPPREWSPPSSSDRRVHHSLPYEWDSAETPADGAARRLLEPLIDALRDVVSTWFDSPFRCQSRVLRCSC